MKPIPPYWAQHHETVTFPKGTTWDMSITGSSFVSQEDAQRDARERLARFVASGGPDGDTPRDWYYPDRHLPEELLEEVHGESGELIAVVTRNRYGAAILNTDAVLIADVDVRVPSARQARQAERRAGDRTHGAGSRRGGSLLGRLFGRGSTGPRSGPTGSTGPRHGTAAGQATPPGPGARSLSGFEARAQQELDRTIGVIDQFAQRYPHLGVRTYRTRNGFRVLITGADAPPRSEHAARIMQELSSDALYMRLCRVQECYRARLTPKPWRIGVRRVHGSGPLWPGTRIEDWVHRYDAASQGYAVCELVSSTGPTPSADEQHLIDLHDRATRPTSGLPLA